MKNFIFENLDGGERIAWALGIALGAHILVLMFRASLGQLYSMQFVKSWAKLRTLTGLFSSILVFVLYFAAFGMIAQEFGVSLTAYLASASVIGLAIGFGSQGVVQDVVTGLTVIFSDLFQVGDLVEVSGQTGEVQSVGMRFTVLLNPFGAHVYIPNRTLSNVIVYPRGYVRCFADVTVSEDKEKMDRMIDQIERVTKSFIDQYPGIVRAEPELAEVVTSLSGRRYLRVKFRIWPNRMGPIEKAFKDELLYNLRQVDTNYAEWMVSINTEVSEQPRALMKKRRRRS